MDRFSKLESDWSVYNSFSDLFRVRGRGKAKDRLRVRAGYILILTNQIRALKRGTTSGIALARSHGY